MKSKSYYMNDEQRKLAEDNVSLVYSMLKKYCLGRQNILDWDDLVSVGYYALCRAAIAYKESMGCAFSTYATKAIISHVGREIQYLCRQSRVGNIYNVSLNNPCSYESDHSELMDFIQDGSVDIEGEVVNKVLLDSIEQYAPTLVELVSRDLVIKDLAAEKGLSKQRIHQKKQSEISNLRRHMKDANDWMPIDYRGMDSLECKYVS